jgi:Domain of unknown function (DUF1996)
LVPDIHKKTLKRLKQYLTLQGVKIAIFVAFFGLAGATMWILGSAATPSFSIQAEEGLRTGNASQCGDHIKFGGQNCSNAVYRSPLRNSAFDSRPYSNTLSNALNTNASDDSFAMVGRAGFREDLFKHPTITESECSTSACPLREASAFRTLCVFSHFNYDDPIVYPNQQHAAHLHMYLGNTSANAFTTSSSIANEGSGSCSGYELNRTAYWVPALLDSNGNPRTPDFVRIYYKAQGGRLIQNMPQGLKMLAGNPRATTAQPLPYTSRDLGAGGGEVGWFCSSWNDANRYEATIPRCTGGEAELGSVIRFPSCNARNADGTPVLDSVDHRSHMYFVGDWQRCPASHPIPYPLVSYHFFWGVASGENTSSWKISSDFLPDGRIAPSGMTLHADWMGGWNTTIINKWTRNCNWLSMNCSTDLLNDGPVRDANGIAQNGTHIRNHAQYSITPSQTTRDNFTSGYSQGPHIINKQDLGLLCPGLNTATQATVAMCTSH